MTPPITHIPKSNMADKAKPRVKMGRPKGNSVLVKTYSFTNEPLKQDKFDKMCERLGRSRVSLVLEGMEMVEGKYYETSS